MPAQSRRHIDTVQDDPWGFGAPDGTLVEVRYEPQIPGLGRVMPERRAPEPAPAEDAIDLTQRGGKPPHVPHEPAGDARLQLDAPAGEYEQYFRPRPRPWHPRAALVVALVAVLGYGGYVWSTRAKGAAAVTSLPTGTFVLSSQPAGADVLVDGIAAGRTPLALPLTPGDHTIVATGENGVSQRLTARVGPGESVAEHVILDTPVPDIADAPPRGRDPVASGARRGAEPGADDVAASPAVSRRVEPPTAAAAVTTPARVTPTLAPSAAAVATPSRTSAPAAATPSRPSTATAAATSSTPGFVVFDLPFAVQVFEGGTLLGTGERVRVAAGTHTFTLVSNELGFRTDEAVTVAPGQTTRHVVEQRSAPLSINALPWAEVFISGRSFGETPLANIALPIGTYQVTLRHPTFGERQIAVTVKLGAPNRLAVDMRP